MYQKTIRITTLLISFSLLLFFVVKLNSLSPQKTLEEIEKVHKENKDVFSLVDETIIKIEQEKIEEKEFIDSLGTVIDVRGEQIKKTKQKLYLSKEEMETIKCEKLKLEEERNKLKKCYEKLNNTLEILENTKKETQVRYDSLNEVNKKLKEQVKLVEVETIFIKDTIFVKDTIYLTKKQKKRLLNKK